MKNNNGAFEFCSTKRSTVVSLTSLESPNFLKLRATFWVSINVKGYQLDIHFWNKNFAELVFNYVIINKINDINLCENTDDVNIVFRTGPQATHLVCAGNLVPAGTMLVTPHYAILIALPFFFISQCTVASPYS